MLKPVKMLKNESMCYIMINNSKDYLRCVSKPNFISQKMFDKTFVAIHEIGGVRNPLLTMLVL